MSYISVFDLFKLGVGPSSSHTLGPWKAAERFLQELEGVGLFDQETAEGGLAVNVPVNLSEC